ncbi:MAG: SAM-dependent methyltransferase [Sphingomicrobium sp.]
MSAPIFDDHLRQLRRARAERRGGERFLHARAFDDCLDRLVDIRREFSNALIVGTANDGWIETLSAALPGATVDVVPADQLLKLEPGSFDLCLSIGELETDNDLAAAALALRCLLVPGELLLGAIAGGNSLPRLRGAMLAADRLAGGAASHVHPSIDGPSLSALLTSAGFTDPVVDVDRVDVSYPGLDRLVADLRNMGCTNVLAQRSRQSLSKKQRDIARSTFLAGGERAIERFELHHFTAWAPTS